MARDSSGAMTRVSNSFTNPINGETIRASDASTYFDELDTELTDSLSRSGKGGMLDDLDLDGNAITNATSVGLKGSSSGTTTVQASATASGTITLPAATDTLVGKATTDTLTNKSINASNNTITNLTTAMFAANVVDTDGTLAANSDTRIPSQKAFKTYADQLIAANDAMVFKGVIDCSANPNYPAADRGHTYKVSVAGKIGGASGVNVEAGDILICLTDGTAAGNQATVGTAWTISQANIDGAVTGPASSTSGNIATFNGTTGKIIQDGGKALPSGALLGTTDSQSVSNKTITGSTFSGLTVTTTTGTLTIASGKTATVSNTLTFTGTDGSSVAFGAGGTVAYTSSGTWTPTIAGGTTAGTSTYSEQTGYYIQVGKQVTVWGRIVLSARSGGSGTATISGLPFAAATHGFINYAGSIACGPVAHAAGYNQFTLQVARGDTTLIMQEAGDNVALGQVPITNVGGTAVLIFSATYDVP